MKTNILIQQELCNYLNLKHLNYSDTKSFRKYIYEGKRKLFPEIAFGIINKILKN